MTGIDPATAKTIHGLDASRRTGWARYFDAVEDLEELRQRANRAVALTLTDSVAMALMVIHHDRLAANDPLVVYATDLLTEVGATPAGHSLIETVKRSVL